MVGSTEPFQSFHLATAYAPLTKDSPLRPAQSEGKDTTIIAKAAITAFRAWCKRFRSAGQSLSLRFTVSDALRFCQVLQTYKARSCANLPLWYRDVMHYEPLTLDAMQYPVDCSGIAAFDVINTSNLVDFIGCLNLLAATAPLLKNEGSTVYMELLLLRDESLHAYANDIMCGDIPTISALFGLNLIQYWSNVSTYSPYAECVLKALSDADAKCQGRSILMWKRANFNNIDFDPQELAQFVYQMSLRMFHHESKAAVRAKTWTQLFRHPAQHYTRAGFAIILKVIRENRVVDFGVFIEQLSTLLSDDRHLDMGPCYQHSLFVHLHQLCLFTPAMYTGNWDGTMLNLEASPLQKWLNIPATLHLTFVVSTPKMALFHKRVSAVTPELHVYQVTLRSSVTGQQHILPDIQLGIGSVRTTGIRHTETFTMRVELNSRDPDMVVSLLVPTCLVLQDADLSTVVLFHLIATPSSQRLGGGSDSDLLIHSLRLSDQDVFITKDPPNLAGYMLATGSESLSDNMSQMVTTSKAAPTVPRAPTVTFQAIFNSQRSRIQQLYTRVDLSSTKAADLLCSGAKVQIKQQSSFVVELLIGSGPSSFQQDIEVPLPLAVRASKLRIARAASYVEITAPVASNAWLSRRPESAFPISLRSGDPILDRLPYVHLDCLPILDTRDVEMMEWLNAHVGSMFSAREAKHFEQFEQFATSGGTTDDLRYNLKTILLDVLRNAAGFGVRPSPQIVAVGSGPPETGQNMFLLVSARALKLDLSSLSVVLDAAMVPAPILLPRPLRIKLLQHSAGMGIAWDIEQATFRAWNHAVAAFVERGREWEHGPGCEYAATGASIPLSVEAGKSPVCSCGLGKFPEDYMPELPFWKDIAKYCVRVAICPIYYSPLVEEMPDFTAGVGWVSEEQSTPENTDDVRPLCRSCKAEASAERKLLRCARCKAAQYCSKECLGRDWKEGGHKLKCV
ncbi:hypothetical protein A1O7_06427 [Cladophialophora yegresii CBS 114405]|uniref:MYND-type domain-containing protein n=1 Tax=Cladophialophora yegresii CBS 114405 TaxID=1182544 RepID=W9W381_9EURO|nr:uncharacterized protein A1O7_06427 [Cladophialophora yegresii CBS 114405]EXJ58996.1 hypothetical protein A1O7_06427 [Cladophialophora yegresii CBS 114405]